MSEIWLGEKNAELKGKMQECLKREKANTKLMKSLSHKLVVTQKENVLRTENTDRVRKELTEKTDILKGQLKKKMHENITLSQDIARLTAKLDIQRIELQQVKHKSSCNEKLLAENARSLSICNNRVAELTRNLATLQRNNEELQKSLLTEKKMSRFFIKERDQLLEQQDKRYIDADRELSKLKQSVATLTKTLALKMTECKAQRKAARSAAVSFDEQSRELRSKIEELEQKLQEVENKTCEYCGL